MPSPAPITLILTLPTLLLATSLPSVKTFTAVSSSLELLRNTTEVCRMLLHLELYGTVYVGNQRSTDLLQACVGASGNGSEFELREIVITWLMFPKFNLKITGLADDDCIRDFFFPLDRKKEQLMTECFCNISCEHDGALATLGTRIVRQLTSDYALYSGGFTGNKQTLADGFYCTSKEEDHDECCYVYYGREDLHADRFYISVNMGTAHPIYSGVGTYKSWYNQFLCLMEVYTNQKFQSLQTEQCETESSAHVEQTRAVIDCVTNSLEETLLRYQLSFTELSFMELIHFVIHLHDDLCDQTIENMCPQVPRHKHPDQVIGRMASLVLRLMIPIDVTIILLNSILCWVAHNGRRKLGLKQKRPLVFLINIAIVNILFAIVDLTSIVWTLTPGGFRDHVNQASGNSLDKFLLIHCCVGHLSMQTTWSMTARLTRTFHAYAACVLVAMRLVCQCVSLLTFVTFGVFQVVPLLRPLKQNRWLDHPKRIAVAIWLVSIGLFSIVSGVTTTFYMEQKRYLKEATLSSSSSIVPSLMKAGGAGVMQNHTFQVTNPSLSVSDKLLLIDAVNASEIGVPFVLLILGELASTMIICLVIFLRCKRRKIRSTAVLSHRTVKSVIVIGIAQTAAFCSALPMLLLWHQVQLDSLGLKNMTEKQIYLDNAEAYIKHYLAARIVLLIEPVLSPIFILIRYDFLAKALWNDLRNVKQSMKLKRKRFVNAVSLKLRSYSTELRRETHDSSSCSNSSMSTAEAAATAVTTAAQQKF